MRLDGRIDAARLGASGAAEGTTLVWRNGRFVAETPAGGGGAMGAALVVVTFPSITSVTTSTFTSATGSSIGYSYGAHGISDDGLGTVTYCDDSVPSVYIGTGVVAVAPPTVYSLSDMHQLDLYDEMVSGMASFFNHTNSDFAYPTFAGNGFNGMEQLSAPSSSAPEVRIVSQGGAGLVFPSVTLYVSVTRFALA